MDCTISLYLDERREKKDNTFPVKLNVFTNYPKKQKLYSTGISVTKQVYELTQNSKNNKNEIREIRDRLIEIRANAIKVAESIKPFDWNIFELKMTRKKGDSQNVFFHFEEKIKLLLKNEQFSTADSNQNAMKSLKSFLSYLNNGKEVNVLNFEDITNEWLNKFESYCINIKLNALGTVGHYTRDLKAIFNSAIKKNDISPNIYPFNSSNGNIKNKEVYKIPAVRKVNKALQEDEVLKILNYKPKTNAQELARDLFLFSLFANGINMMDMAYLKFENLENDKITYYRKKTFNSRKENLESIKVVLIQIALEILEKYKNKDEKPQNLIFDFITNNEVNPSIARSKVKSFTKRLNDQMKKIAKEIGISEQISFYWARHTFANTAIKNNKSKFYLKQAFGHTTFHTTEVYLQGFNEDENRRNVNDMFDFIKK